GLYSLLAVRAAVGRPGEQNSAAATTARTAVLRALSARVGPPNADMLDSVRIGHTTAEGLSAAAVREEALVQYDLNNPAAGLVAAYQSSGAGYDYPYVVLPHAGDAVREAAQEFLAAVLDADPRELATRGFRQPDGRIGEGFPDEPWLSS